jgi:hypothetical protein
MRVSPGPIGWCIAWTVKGNSITPQDNKGSDCKRVMDQVPALNRHLRLSSPNTEAPDPLMMAPMFKSGTQTLGPSAQVTGATKRVKGFCECLFPQPIKQHTCRNREQNGDLGMVLKKLQARDRCNSRPTPGRGNPTRVFLKNTCLKVSQGSELGGVL